MKDYYAILKISHKATPEDIKKAFRKLALQYHPDKNKEPFAHRHFTEIQEAYGVLKDPVKRASYNYTRYSFLGATKPPIYTPQDVWEASRKLAETTAGMDPFRVDLDLVSYSIMDILTPDHISILLRSGDPMLCKQVLQHILAAAKLLPYPLASDCIRPLWKLEEILPTTRQELENFLSTTKWNYYWNRYKAVIALLAALAFVSIILLFGRAKGSG